MGRGSKPPSATGRARASRIFVGRERELEELIDALDDTFEGGGDIVVISGPSGIGKTRLAEEVAARAAGLGMRVVWGRCSDDPGSPPLWPWNQILRALTDAPASPISDGSSEDAEHDGAARFRFFDAVADTLRGVAHEQPLLLLFDDVQHADVASMRLLEFVARELRDGPIAIIAIAADTGSPDATSAERVRNLARIGRSIPLRGLARRELSALVHDGFGFDPPDIVMKSLWRLTEGNPFFAVEIIRLFLAERHAGARSEELPLPEGVHDVVRRRLAPLSTETVHALRIASVVGRQFDVAIVAHVAGRSDQDIARAVSELLEHRVIERSADGDALTFSHGLVREALYEQVRPDERVAMHRSIVNALEELDVGSDERRATQLAHHAYEARSLLGDEAAIPFIVTAGEIASERFAYEEATMQYARAVSLLGDGVEGSERARLLVALGESHRKAGAFGPAMEAFDSAASAARTAERPDLFVRAAVGLEDTRAASGDFTRVPQSMSLLAEALEVIDPPDDLLRAEVMSRRPLVLHFVGATEMMLGPAKEAVEIAERSGDRRLLLRTLEGLRAAYWSAEAAGHRLETTERYVAAARGTHQADAIARGEIFRFLDLLAVGRGEELDRQIMSVSSTVGASRGPSLAWWPAGLRGTRSLMRGDLGGAREHAMALSALANEDDAFALAAVALLKVGYAWEAGDRDELRTAIATMARVLPVPVARSALRAFSDVVCGDLAGARKAFEEAATGRFAAVLRGSALLPIACLLAHVCGRLGDADRAEMLYELIGDGPPIVVIVPPMAATLTTPHWLGVLGATAGRIADAERHFEQAEELHERLGAPAWVARTRVEWGSALLDVPSKRRRGREILEAGAHLATTLGLATLEQRATTALAGTADAAAAPSENAFVREGDVWRVTFDGKTVRVADLKGLAYLRVLLGMPGEEIHVLRLPGLAEGAASGTSDERAFASDLRPDAPSDEMIDQAAARSYRTRLDELRDEIDEADALGDDERSSRARTEADQIAAELGRSLGLGGRHRRAGTPVERTRINVQRTVRTAIDRISAVHPALARHLTDTVRTGTYCVYLSAPGQKRWTL